MSTVVECLLSQSAWLASCAGSRCVSSLSVNGRRGWNDYVWCSIFMKGKKDSSRWVFHICCPQAQLPALTGCGGWRGNIHSGFAIFNLPQKLSGEALIKHGERDLKRHVFTIFNMSLTPPYVNRLDFYGVVQKQSTHMDKSYMLSHA